MAEIRYMYMYMYMLKLNWSPTVVCTPGVAPGDYMGQEIKVGVSRKHIHLLGYSSLILLDVYSEEPLTLPLNKVFD